MKNLSKFAFCALVIGATVFTSCNDDENNDPAPAPSIYARLGGSTLVDDPNSSSQIEAGRLAFRSVVDTTINLIVADIVAGNPGNLGEHFAPIAGEVFGNPPNATNVAILSDNLTDFFSFNTGGTNAVNTYSGLDMVAAHDPAQNPRMGVKSTDADYDRFVGFVGQAAILNNVPANSQLLTDIGAVLESLRAPIVQAQ